MSTAGDQWAEKRSGSRASFTRVGYKGTMTYTNAEMLELVAIHFSEAWAGRHYSQWDWSLPLYLIEGVSGWSEARLARIVDFYHNGPDWAR